MRFCEMDAIGLGCDSETNKCCCCDYITSRSRALTVYGAGADMACRITSKCRRRLVFQNKISAWFLFVLTLYCFAELANCDLNDTSVHLSRTLNQTGKDSEILKTRSNLDLSTTDLTAVNCANVHERYNTLVRNRGFGADSSSSSNSLVENLTGNVCAANTSCCDSDMEHQLIIAAELDHRRMLEDKIIGLRHTFESYKSKFDRFFRELLIKSRRDLNSMFIQTYGMFYQQNSDIFGQLFDSLTDYYLTGGSDLDGTLQSFYRKLYVRMFQIMNPQYQYTAEYWICMEPTIDQLQPFGLVPNKMQQQIRRSFIAARTFVQGLATGQDAVQDILQLKSTAMCRKAVMRMSYCPLCSDLLTGVKPCRKLCMSVMNSCLADQALLDPEWDAYTEGLLELLKRLEGSFNIESVIEPIGLKISEAIMIFQEKGKEIGDKQFQIQQGCDPAQFGVKPINPAVTRFRRSRITRKGRPGSLELLQYPRMHSHLHRQSPSGATRNNLSQLALEVREKLELHRNFWRSLSYSLCSEEQFSMLTDGFACWNGIDTNSEQETVADDEGLNQLGTHAMKITSTPTNSVVDHQISQLRQAAERLHQAYGGQNINWQIKSVSDRIEKYSSGVQVKETVVIDDVDTEEFSGSGDWEDASGVQNSQEIVEELQNNQKEKNWGGIPEETDDEDLVKALPDNSAVNVDPVVYGSGDLYSAVEVDDFEEGSGRMPSFADINKNLYEMTAATPRSRTTTVKTTTTQVSWIINTEASTTRDFQINTHTTATVKPGLREEDLPTKSAFRVSSSFTIWKVLWLCLVLWKY